MVQHEDLLEKSSEALLEEYKETQDIRLKQELVLRYVYIVKNIAIQMRGVYVSFTQIDDIINEGVLALMTAIDKFDIDKGVKFETYVSKRIRGLIIDIARRQDWIPRSIRRRAKEMEQATTELYQKLGRMPTEEEIAKYLSISLEKYQEELGKASMYHVISLETVLEDPVNSVQTNSLQTEDKEILPEVFLENQEFRRVLREGLDTLRDNEKMVISLYYRKELNMKEIATVMGLSEPRISQIHANAKRKLKLYLENSMLGSEMVRS